MQVLLASVSAVGREGVCGNGICEVGELLPIAASGGIGKRCVEDCPLEVIGCLHNDAGDVCSGMSHLHPCNTALFVLPATLIYFVVCCQMIASVELP